ncbi:MAG: TOPRIM nucleotidyl transferase/hydrolase domain-containing protein [Mycobacteriales bacterium]
MTPRTPPVDIVAAVVTALTQRGAVAAVGGSGLLAALGLAEIVRDWDVTTDADEATVEEALDSIGVHYQQLAAGDRQFRTRARYVIAAASHDIDVLVGFALDDGQRVIELPTRVTREWRGLPIADPAVWAEAYRLLGRADHAESLQRWRDAQPETVTDRLRTTEARVVVLVEGASDQAALETLAHGRGNNLAGDGVAVVSMGGVTNIRASLERFGPHGMDLGLAGLCDAGEASIFRRALEGAGLGASPSGDDMERLGFYICAADLEDELIRALGADTIERIIDTAGETGPWTTFRKQSAQQGRAIEAQLRRFMGTHSGRKIRYARLLVEALHPAQVPRPLDRVLAHARLTASLGRAPAG